MCAYLNVAMEMHIKTSKDQLVKMLNRDAFKLLKVIPNVFQRSVSCCEDLFVTSTDQDSKALQADSFKDIEERLLS